MLSWPFLISRNRTIDYRVIAAPDFLVSDRQEHILTNVPGNQITKKPIRYKLSSNAGLLNLIFTVKFAKANHTTLRDEFGRSILWIEGLVFRDNIEGLEVSQADFQRLHKQMQIVFQSFWEVHETKFEVVASSPIEINFGESPRLEVEPVEKKQLSTKTSEGWSSVNKNSWEQYYQLEQEREKIDKKYKVGLFWSIVGLPLIALGVGIVIVPVGGIVAWQNYQKRTDLDEQITKLKDKLQ